MAKRKSKKRPATKPGKAIRPIARKPPPKAKAKPAPKASKSKVAAKKKLPRKLPAVATVKRKQPAKSSAKRTKLSQAPAAIAARQRRAAARAERERALRAEQKKADARRKKRTKQQRKRRREQRRQREIGEYALAKEWLESISERMAEVFENELIVTEPGGGVADLTGEAAELEDRTSWLIVGRFDPAGPISYAELAMGFQLVADDLILETRINGQRLSQIRVVFHDPNETRHEGDSVISKIGAWEYVTSDLVGELVGSNLENPDEGSLAARYKETNVSSFYIFFSSEITAPRNVFSGRAGTTTIPWGSKATKKG